MEKSEDDLKEKSKKIIKYIDDGLTENDAVLFAGLSQLEYSDMIKKIPAIKDLVNKAIVGYKHKLIKTVSETAGQGDSKLAQWLLEKKFGEEYNQKVKDGVGNNTAMDMLFAAVKHVQQDGSSTTLIGIKQKTIPTYDTQLTIKDTL
jgi:GTP-sensing pleiotropic transcriptional regulator CodY